jgi:hypothetical protein
LLFGRGEQRLGQTGLIVDGRADQTQDGDADAHVSRIGQQTQQRLRKRVRIASGGNKLQERQGLSRGNTLQGRASQSVRRKQTARAARVVKRKQIARESVPVCQEETNCKRKGCREEWSFLGSRGFPERTKQ